MNLTHLALAVLVTAGASSFVAFQQGETHERGRRAQIDLAAAAASSEASSSAAATIASLTRKAAEIETVRQSGVREIRNTIRETIREPIYQSVCLPVDAVGLLDTATDIANGKPAREPVPSGDAAGTAEAAPAD